MKFFISSLCLFIFCLTIAAQTSQAPATANFEENALVKNSGKIDKILFKYWKKQNIAIPQKCTDAVFIRRIYLDLTGRLPNPAEVKKWLATSRADKRAVLIDSLLADDDFAVCQTMKWGDVLRLKSEFPINLWPNAAQAYHRYIYDAVKNNMPYDKFTRELLTASGSNFRTPQVNFYRAVADRSPSGLANAVSLTFMGIRIDSWPEDKRHDITRFFSRVGFKSTSEWKEEIVYPKLPSNPMQLVRPDGKKITIDAENDPRQAFADYLLDHDNPYFSRTIANRVWFWMFGRGIIDPVDDMTPDNPPFCPELLDFLSETMVDSRYDLKTLYRIIANSAAYQSSSVGMIDPAAAEKGFAAYPLRRLDAEILCDAIGDVTGVREKFTSVIPEPFSFMPPDQRAVELPDGSITSVFLIMFGRPARDSGLADERNNNISVQQRLMLFNSGELYRRLNTMVQSAEFNTLNTPEKKAEYLYLRFYCRLPDATESATIITHFQKSKNSKNNDFWRNLAWILLNSKEFLYRH